MTIPRDQIEALKAFGYTEDEARFLYLVATHSGYFLARQFLSFVGAKRGYRTHSLTQKLITQGHASMREYRRNGCIYHLYSRKLYAQIGRENLRNRRRHRLEAIKTRLLSLDFILANQGYQYLEGESEKLAHFTEVLHIQKQCLPVKLYTGGRERANQRCGISWTGSRCFSVLPFLVRPLWSHFPTSIRASKS